MNSIRTFATSARAAKTKNANFSGAVVPFDIANLSKVEFNFPLTRNNLIKVEFRRKILNYLRLEQNQFSQLGVSSLSTLAASTLILPSLTVQFRQRFVKPSKNQIIQLRTQHYQGEPHPADRKATITLSIAALFPSSSPNSAQHSHKFKLLAGPRWDSLKNEFKISCELFPTVKMNEKWCSDTLDKLLVEAKVSLFSLVPLRSRC